jgi:hypothetical protein
MSDSWMCTQTYYGPTARQLNFADLLGPPPSSAYFDAIPPLFEKRQNAWQDMCRTTICEDQFFPQILMPSMITDLEPAFKSCSRIGYPVWDPPKVLTGTTEVQVPSITVESAHNRPDQKNTPMPGSPIVNASPTMTDVRGSQTQSPDSGRPKGNAGYKPQPEALIGLYPSDLGDMPPPSAVPAVPPPLVVDINGKAMTIALNVDGSQRRGFLVVGSVTLKPGDAATLEDGQLLSYGTQGNLYRGAKTAASIAWDSIATDIRKLSSTRGRSTLSRTGESREFYEQPPINVRKKSEATRIVGTLPLALFLLPSILLLFFANYVQGTCSIFGERKTI